MSRCDQIRDFVLFRAKHVTGLKDSSTTNSSISRLITHFTGKHINCIDFAVSNLNDTTRAAVPIFICFWYAKHCASLAFINVIDAHRFVFLVAGRASTREECIESSQNVFLRLLAETPGETSLSFNVLALVALQSDGTLVPAKVKDMIRLFRPNRSGSLTMIDFIKSVDLVYKELRLLRASVRNSQKLDQSAEKIFNVLFYTVILCICLAVLGFDPLAIFISFSSFALAFSFMISRASSNYFEVSWQDILCVPCGTISVVLKTFSHTNLLVLRACYSSSSGALTISVIGSALIYPKERVIGTARRTVSNCEAIQGYRSSHVLYETQAVTLTTHLFSYRYAGLVKDIDLFTTTIAYGTKRERRLLVAVAQLCFRSIGLTHVCFWLQPTQTKWLLCQMGRWRTVA